MQLFEILALGNGMPSAVDEREEFLEELEDALDFRVFKLRGDAFESRDEGVEEPECEIVFWARVDPLEQFDDPLEEFDDLLLEPDDFL